MKSFGNKIGGALGALLDRARWNFGGPYVAEPHAA